jgi:AraC-like DNA-binding protein
MKNFAKSAPLTGRKPDTGKKRSALFNSAVLRWNLLYAFFMLAALVAFSLFNSRCIHVIEESRTLTNTVVLETVRVRMDNFLTEISALSNTLSLSDNMQNVMASASSEEVSRYHLSALVNEFSRYEFLHGGSEQFLYFPYMDMAMNTTGYGDARFQYDKRFADSGTDYAQWLAVIDREYAGTRLVSLKTESGVNLLLAIRTIHTLPYYTHYCNVVTMIDSSTLLGTTLDEDMGTLFFCDVYNGQVVSSRPGDWTPLLTHRSDMNEAGGSFKLKLLKENMVVTYSQSKTSTLIYGIANSEKAYFGFITKLSQMLWAVGAAYVLLSVWLVVYSVCRNYRWIHSITDFVSKPQATVKGDKEYQSIISPIATLIDQNKEMKTKADQQERAIRHSLLQRLIDTADPLRLPQKQLLDSYGICFREGSYAVVAFSIDHPRGSLRDLICTVAVNTFRQQEIQAYPLVENTTVLFILNGAMPFQPFGEALGRAVEAARQEITRGGVQPFCLAVSDTVDSPQKLNAAYNNVLRVFDYRDEHGNRVEYFSELTAIPAEAVLRYSAETDARLYTSITSGNDAEATQVITEVMADNEKNFLSDGSLLFLTGNLLNTICRAGEVALKYAWTAPGEAEVDAIFAEHNPQKLRKRLCGLAEKTCVSVQEYRAKHRELKNLNAYLAAQNYVLQNFQDVNLSVNSIAEKLNLSVSVLSKLFHEESGDNLSVYINRVRTAEAKKCLQNGMRLDEIAEHCGFGSQRTFLRVFKQYVAMTPTQFKNTSAGTDAPPEQNRKET